MCHVCRLPPKMARRFIVKSFCHLLCVRNSSYILLELAYHRKKREICFEYPEFGLAPAYVCGKWESIFRLFFFICVANASYTNKYTDSANFFPFRRAHLSFLLSFRAAVTILTVCDALTHITLNTYWRIFSRPSAHRTNLLTLTENKERERRRRSVSMCIVTSVPHMSNVNNCWT